MRRGVPTRIDLGVRVVPVGLLGQRDALLDRGTGIGGSKADFAKAHRRDLIAGGDQAVGAGLQIAAMDGQHLLAAAVRSTSPDQSGLARSQPARSSSVARPPSRMRSPVRSS